MIYPTRTAVAAAILGAPIALAAALALPDRWYAGLAWSAAVLLLVLVDAVAGRARVSATLTAPAIAAVGEPIVATIALAFAGKRSPHSAQVALAPDPLLALERGGMLDIALAAKNGASSLAVIAARRGSAQLAIDAIRWAGPLGLVWHHTRGHEAHHLAALPDVRTVEERGAEIFRRYAVEGLMAQVDRGEGSDFDTLAEYRPGMDRRAIDWKQSARHRRLYAKEYHTDLNSQIVLAIDAGRQMSEPVAGVPRIDRAVAAALLTGWVALKLGDRVALTAFDARPRIASGFVGGARAFSALQHLAAEIDYSAEETNYTFALTTLATRLTRRSMIVLFTEFTDATAADFLVRAVARLIDTHLVLIVVLRDEELETIVDAAPVEPADVTRAITAAALLRDRRLVVRRLQHLGVHVIESEHDRVAERLVEGYVALKRRNLL